LLGKRKSKKLVRNESAKKSKSQRRGVLARLGYAGRSARSIDDITVERLVMQVCTDWSGSVRIMSMQSPTRMRCCWIIVYSKLVSPTFARLAEDCILG
jgi:hypothetical protein